MQTHRLHIGQGTVDCSYIELYHSTHESRLRWAPKLTNRHIYQKPFNIMNVKWVTQVLRVSVCVEIMASVYTEQLPGDSFYGLLPGSLRGDVSRTQLQAGK